MEQAEHHKKTRDARFKGRYDHLTRGSMVEVTSKEPGFVGSWFEAMVIKPPEKPNSKLKKKRIMLVEYTNLVDEDGTVLLRELVDADSVRPLPPKREGEGEGGFEVGDLVDTFDRDGWWVGIVERVIREEGKEERYAVGFEEPEHEIEFGKGKLRFHLDWMNGKWFPSQNDKPQEPSITSDGCMTLTKNSSGSEPKELVQLKSPVATEFNADHCPGMMPLMNELSTPPNDKLSPRLSASCPGETIYLEYPNSSSTYSRPTKKLKKTGVEDPFVHVSIKQAEITNKESDLTPLYIRPAFSWEDNGINPLRNCRNKEAGTYLTSASSGPYNASGHAKRRKRRAKRSEGIPNVLLAPGDMHSAEMMEEQSLVVVGTELTHKKQGEVQKAENVHKNPSTEERSIVAAGTDLTHIAEGHSYWVEDGGMSLGTVGRVVVPSEGQPASNAVVQISQSLPFVKSSPIWKAVEGLEIFKKFPQRPHFLPLMDAREGTREGLAIANMVTFASTVENVIKSSINDPMSSFTDYLETLHGLESHGFSTKTIESHLMKLLSLKETQQKIDKKKDEVEGQISELTDKKTKLGEDICNTVKKIKSYQEQLVMALVARDEHDLEISSLKIGLDVMDTVMRSTELDFVD